MTILYNIVMIIYDYYIITTIVIIITIIIFNRVTVKFSTSTLVQRL